MSITYLPEYITIDNIKDSLIHYECFSLKDTDWERVSKNEAYLNAKLASGQTYYGINTGFGSLCNVRIDDNELSQLQENLVKSHACGMGEEIHPDIAKLLFLLKIKNMSLGYSGITRQTLNRCILLYNHGVVPVIYSQGSLGASGDLAPLAHMSLPLLGLGEVYLKGERMSAQKMHEIIDIEPIQLSAKEGLALLNGTQFMSAHAVWALMESKKIIDWADIITALSCEGFNVKKEPFHPAIHRVRPHQGQIATAEILLQLLNNSPLQETEKRQVQDPYSFRCVPQIHGATKDAWNYVKQVVEIEINSVTDNPLVVEEDDVILSGGNFHGQPLAINLDFLAIAMAELANVSERRTYLLISGQRDLPPFLSNQPGVNSGLMIPQYTAASIVSQNKQLCTPASIDSIVSSNGQEDHVSMGANAATKLVKVIQNVKSVLAIELLNALYAIQFRRPLQSSPILERVINDALQHVPVNINEDVYLHESMKAAEQFLTHYDPQDYLKELQ